MTWLSLQLSCSLAVCIYSYGNRFLGYRFVTNATNQSIFNFDKIAANLMWLLACIVFEAGPLIMSTSIKPLISLMKTQLVGLDWGVERDMIEPHGWSPSCKQFEVKSHSEKVDQFKPNRYMMSSGFVWLLIGYVKFVFIIRLFLFWKARWEYIYWGKKYCAQS